MLTAAMLSFDFGDFTPDNRTAGVPFVQMLAMTNLQDAMDEFTQVRDQQVQKSNQQLANPSDDGTGSLVLNGDIQLGNANIQADLNTLAKRLSREHPATAHMRVVITQHARPMMPIRVMHHVAGCMSQMADAFGPAAVALLAGTFSIVLMMLVVGAVLGVRELVRYRRAAAGYEPLDLDCEAKDVETEGAVVFDAEQYNHHVVTQHTPVTTTQPYP